MLVALSPTFTAASARSSGISHRVCTLAYTIVMTMIVYCSKCAIFWNSTHVVCRIHPTSRVGGKAQIKFNMLEPPPHVRGWNPDLLASAAPPHLRKSGGGVGILLCVFVWEKSRVVVRRHPANDLHNAVRDVAPHVVRVRRVVRISDHHRHFRLGVCLPEFRNQLSYLHLTSLFPATHVREQRDDLRFAEVPGKTQYHCVEGASVSRETRKSVVRQSTTMWRGPVSRVR